jgi:hypothetical protein
MIEPIYCIKKFVFIGKDNNLYTFEVGKRYDYWSNFGGLNHFARYNQDEVYPFDGPNSYTRVNEYTRPYIFDYFTTQIDIIRESQLNRIL